MGDAVYALFLTEIDEGCDVLADVGSLPGCQAARDASFEEPVAEESRKRRRRTSQAEELRAAAREGRVDEVARLLDSLETVDRLLLIDSPCEDKGKK
mmetsp:Transcript_63502/g.114410  ORF Transcript_63502/g.114410 Transcript_63502/m.114410 type:complete len:97 (-) Transcript_63502:51-341(-)